MHTSVAMAPADTSPRLHNMAWLLQLRWLALLGQCAAIFIIWRESHAGAPLLALYGITAITAVSNAALSGWLRRGPNIEDWMLSGVMALDFVLLTALLYYSGGPSNPFTVLFLVNVALAAVVLKPHHAWALAVLSSACFLALFVLPSGHAPPEPGMSAAPHAGHHAMSMHLRGMWIAFIVAATLIAYFITRVTRDLEKQRSAASLARTRALRSEKLASLATLAAGAAHELSTPLATIAIAAKELARELGAAAPQSAADVQLIREEVERCKHILSQMASEAGESAGEAFVAVRLSALLEQALEGVSERARVQVNLGDDPLLKLPVRALAGALRGLINNALQASTAQVRVEGRLREGELVLEIIDHGAGIPASVMEQVGEPFFTTKQPGRGMGLGVFLARALAERLGGSLELSSQLARGTTARVVLPHAGGGTTTVGRAS